MMHGHLQHNMHCCIYCHQTELQAHWASGLKVGVLLPFVKPLLDIQRIFTKHCPPLPRWDHLASCSADPMRLRYAAPHSSYSTLHHILLLPLLLLPLLLQLPMVTCAQLPALPVLHRVWCMLRC
jgi:hypothetical protein